MSDAAVERTDVAIIGADIIGLATALRLLEQRPELAGDLDLEIIARRAAKGLPAILQDLEEAWLDVPLDRPLSLVPLDEAEAILRTLLTT